MADQLSAELDSRFSAGPLNAGPIVRVRDLIVCAADSTDVPIEEVYAHPPIGWERHPGMDEGRGPPARSLLRPGAPVRSALLLCQGGPPRGAGGASFRLGHRRHFEGDLLDKGV